MANFIPLKHYFFYCLDRAIVQAKIKPPFLDMGCGVGDVSYYLAKKGWSGVASDFSAESIEIAKNRLKKFKKIQVKKADLFSLKGKFNSIFLLDVLEHIDDDVRALKKIHTLLEKNGILVMIIPYNPMEWRWDDEFYGHYRRYTINAIVDILDGANLTPEIIWNCTFPMFWFMRRIYTKIWSQPEFTHNKTRLTKASSMQNAWTMPVIFSSLNNLTLFWHLVYKVQFIFKKYLGLGHEVLIVARIS